MRKYFFSRSQIKEIEHLEKNVHQSRKWQQPTSLLSIYIILEIQI